MKGRAFQTTAFTFFGTTIVLMVLAASVGLLRGAERLSGYSLGTLDGPQLEVLTLNLFQLSAVGGLIGSGLMIVSEYAAGSRGHDRWLRLVERLWIVLVGTTLLAGLLGFSDGREGLERLAPIDLLELGLLALMMVLLRSFVARSPVVLVLLIGIGVHIIAISLGLMPMATYTLDRLLRALSLGLDRNLALPLGALATAYRLMARFSAARADWLDESLYTTAGLIALAGALLTVADLYPLTAASWLATLGSVSSVAVPVIMVIIAGHFYRVLARRRDNATLAAHWVALGLVFTVLGAGILGGLGSEPSIRRWLMGTRLDDARVLLAYLLPVAVSLGMINQSAADLHGEDGRITGYIPFWLVGAGVLATTALLVAIGVGQVYMERVIAVDFVQAETLLIPLYRLTLGAWLLLALGMGIYAFTFWLRRPPEPEV